MPVRFPVLLLIVFAVHLPSLLGQGGWTSLFDGESLRGWRANENPDSWRVEAGAIVTRGDRSHLFYVGNGEDASFRNFEFRAEVMTEPGANSGIYVHTRFQDEGWPERGYELQVINSPPSKTSDYVERKMTGSIYAIRNTWRSPVADGEWFDYRIRVQGKTIQTFINGVLICEYTEPEKPWRPDDKRGRLLGSGAFALQAHDPDSVVRYRKLAVRRLPDDLPSLGEPLADAELDRLITRFSNSNHALIDIGVEGAQGMPSARRAFEQRRFGMTYWEVEASDLPSALLVVNDRLGPPDPAALRAAKAAGIRIAFSSGGASGVTESRLLDRLQALSEADLDWSDLWMPER